MESRQCQVLSCSSRGSCVVGTSTFGSLFGCDALVGFVVRPSPPASLLRQSLVRRVLCCWSL